MKLKTNMIKKVKQKFIPRVLQTNVIKENGDFLRQVWEKKPKDF